MGKIIRRIFLGIAAIIAALALIVVGSVLVDFALGGGRLAAVTNTTIPGIGGGPDVRAYVARPQNSGPLSSGPLPVAIMIHEFYGINESIVDKADGLAEEGYLVIAPDTFRGSTTAWIPRAIYQVIRTQPEDVNQDLDAVYAWIEAQPDADAGRVAILGFCYGGRASLTYSLHNNRLAATVIFYGAPVNDPAVLRTLPGPLLGIFGGADNTIPVHEVNEFDAALTQAGVPHEITIYDGQPHAFITDMAGIRAGGAQGAAWAQMLAFLEQHLPQGEASAPPAQNLDYTAPFDWGYYLALVFEHAVGTASHLH